MEIRYIPTAIIKKTGFKIKIQIHAKISIEICFVIEII